MLYELKRHTKTSKMIQNAIWIFTSRTQDPYVHGLGTLVHRVVTAKKRTDGRLFATRRKMHSPGAELLAHLDHIHRSIFQATEI